MVPPPLNKIHKKIQTKIFTAGVVGYTTTKTSKILAKVTISSAGIVIPKGIMHVNVSSKKLMMKRDYILMIITMQKLTHLKFWAQPVIQLQIVWTY